MSGRHIIVTDPGRYGPPMDDCEGLRKGDIGIAWEPYTSPAGTAFLVCTFKHRFRECGYYLRPEQIEPAPGQLGLGEQT